METEDQNAEKANASSLSKHGPSPLDMPSMTTVAFVLIVAMAFKPLLGFGTGDANLAGLVFVLIVALSALRLYATLPTRIMAKNHMIPLARIDADLERRGQELADLLDVMPRPVFLFTERPGITLQTFGTRHQGYVVVNQVEQEGLQHTADSAILETILTHELGHIRSGDTWKLQMAKQVIRVYLLLMLSILGVSLTNQFAIERLLISGPLGRADLIIAVFLFPLGLGIMLYTLNAMQSAREYYADAWVVRVQGPDQAKNNLARSLVWSDVVWAHGAIAKRTQLTQLRDMANAFSGLSVGARPLNRLLSVTESTQHGAPFRSTMRQVVFSAGLAVGSLLFSLDSGGNLVLGWGMAFGGVLLGVAYLLPCLAETDRELRQPRKQVAAVASAFTKGICAYILLGALCYASVCYLCGVDTSVILDRMTAYLRDLCYIFVYGIMLYISLLSSLGHVRRWLEAVHKDTSRAYMWGTLALTACAQSVWVFSIMLAVLGYVTSLLLGESQQPKILPVVALPILGLCLNNCLRHYVERRRA